MSIVVFLGLTLSWAAALLQQPLPPPPGVLVDVGGRRLHIICAGSGAPTVVFEAGASSFAIDWTLVQREVARTNRTCAYDRAGMGWSDERPDSVQGSTAEDLRALLDKAGERGPFVLVGASRGGLQVRDFLLRYPSDVIGLVFVDATTEDRLFTTIDGKDIAIAEVSAEQLKTTFPREAVKVPRRSPQTGPPFDLLPPDLYRVRISLDERLIARIPDTVPAEAVAKSQESERALLAKLLGTRANGGKPLGSRPTVVLTRGNEKNAAREASHRALAALSTNNRHSVIAGAGHEIHLFDPPAVVLAVSDVVAAIRTNRPLPPRQPRRSCPSILSRSSSPAHTR
jgi:pimeloyl-ACP methyl ester carboxylesterase